MLKAGSPAETRGIIRHQFGYKRSMEGLVTPASDLPPCWARLAYHAASTVLVCERRIGKILVLVSLVHGSCTTEYLPDALNSEIR